jgi:hypothetical protein
MAKYLQKEEN